MSYTLFITAQQVIDLSLSERPNYKADKIRDAIILAAQEEWIRPVLGEAFYHHLQQELSNGELTEYNTILIEKFVRPCLAFYVKYLALPDLENPLTNTGSQELFGQSSKPISKENKVQKQAAAKRTGDSLAGVLTRFIESNKAVFSLYLEENNVRNRVSIRCGVILRKKRKKQPFDVATIQIQNMKTYDYQADESGYFIQRFNDIQEVGEEIDIVIKNQFGQIITDDNYEFNPFTEDQWVEIWINTENSNDYKGTITIAVRKS